MLVDPLVLKKKLNRMATEEGAFAVLSSLLLYVTELAAGDPQLSNKRTKWAEGKENKVSYDQPCPDPNRGQRLTRFQLLRSRFLNNNREPYTKKRREVGKLVIRERLWANRPGNKLDRCRDRKGDGREAEEGASTALSERARWSCMSGKNTVKAILNKFLAAEEKEAKEKSPSWKKKVPNSGLPKIVNRSSVLSKLKEQFEQSALCSAAEVKASLLRKGEKKPRSFQSRKAIRKPEVRVLRTAAMAATDINSPESQYLVCSTVPVPRLSIATEINHPSSWAKNNATRVPFGHDTPVRDKREFGREETLAKAAQDSGDKEESLVPLETMSDAKDCAEAKTESTTQGPSFNPDTDSSSAAFKKGGLAHCILPLSEYSPDCNRDDTPAGPDASTPLDVTSAVQHVKEDSPPSHLPCSSTAEGSHEQNPHDTTTGEVPQIKMYLYSSEEADTEFTEPEENPFFAAQKCFPEQKALESILPFHSPGVQAACKVEPPTENQQLTFLTPASGERPPLVPTQAPGVGGRCSEEAKEGATYHSENKMSSTSGKNYNDLPGEKEEEDKTSNSQTQNKYKTQQPQPPQILIPQNNLANSGVDISNPDVNQPKHTLSSNERQEQKPGAAEEEHIPSQLEETQSPLTSDLVKHSSFITEEDFGNDKSSSANEMVCHANNRALHRTNVTDLETCHEPSKSFIEREEATADELRWPDSEICQSPRAVPLLTPMSGTAEQSIHHTLRSPKTLPPVDLVGQGAGGVADEHASHGCEKHPPSSSEEFANHGNDTREKKTAFDFKKQVLSPNNVTENEDPTDEETNTLQVFEHSPPSNKKPRKHINETTVARKPLLSSEKNQTPTSDDSTKQEGNVFPSSPELVTDQMKLTNSASQAPKHTKDKVLSSNDGTKHENDRMETEETEERNVLHKPEEERVFTPGDAGDHDNSSSNENGDHRPQASPLPTPALDTNIQGAKSTEQSLKHLTPSKEFVKHKDDPAVGENICCSNGKHHVSSSNEPMKRASDSAGGKNVESDFKNYSMPPRNVLRQDNEAIDEVNTSHHLKNESGQHKKNGEGERNTSHDPKNLIPLSDSLVKQDNKLSPPETQKQLSPGDSEKSEAKLAEEKTKHTSEKLHSPSSDKTLKPRERISSGGRKQMPPTVEDTRSPETKVVKEDNEHQHSKNYQLPPSRKSVKQEENTPGENKQQTRREGFMVPDKNAGKEKHKPSSSRKYRSLSSETLAEPQEKSTPEQKQETSASSGFKKPGPNAVKDKCGDPNTEKVPSSKEVVKSREKNTAGDRKEKTSTAEDSTSPEAKAVKEDGKHHCSENHPVPTSRKSSEPKKNIPGGEKQQTVSESFTKPDTGPLKGRSKDPDPEMGQSPSSNSLVNTSQKERDKEKKTTAKKKQLPSPPGEEAVHKTGRPEEKSRTRGRDKEQPSSSAQSDKHSSDGSGKDGLVGCPSKSYQGPLPNDGISHEGSSVPEETSLSNTERSNQSSSFQAAPKDKETPTENRKNQPEFKKYQVLSSKSLVKHEKDVAEREGSWQAAGKAREGKAEVENSSKALAFSKYTVESYGEGPSGSPFKPLIIRIADTFTHHS